MLKPIEYIGPVPNKKKPKPKFGGWIIVFLVTLFVTQFAWPFIEGVAYASKDQPTSELAQSLGDRLSSSPQANDKIAGMAISRTEADLSFDPTYYNLTPKEMTDIDFGDYFTKMREHLWLIKSFRLPEGLVAWGRAFSLLYGLAAELAPGIRPLDVVGPYVLGFLQDGATSSQVRENTTDAAGRSS